MLIKIKCITLKATPFKDKCKILQVLTEEKGIISIIVKALSSKNLNLMSVCSSFTISELVLKKNRSEIYSLNDSTIIDANIYLRKNLKFLNAASFMAKAVLQSSIFQKKDFNIYLLLKIYLKKIDINPNALLTSFLLKILSYEGFLHLKTKCSQCENEALSLLRGESLCIEHSNSFVIQFSKEEFKKIFVLCFSKSFSLLKEIEVSDNLKEKINILFKELV